MSRNLTNDPSLRFSVINERKCYLSIEMSLFYSLWRRSDACEEQGANPGAGGFSSFIFPKHEARVDASEAE